MMDLTHRLTNPTNSFSRNGTRRPGLVKCNYFHTRAVTHVDAPGCFVEGGKSLDSFGLDSFLLKGAVLLDLSHKRAGESIEDEDLEAAEESAGVAVREGEIVILQTGWDELSRRSSSTRHPFLSENGAEFLAFKHVTGVGVDTWNLDRAGNRGFPAHRILMRSGILVFESLCNLREIDQSRFRLVALPLRTKVFISAVRAVALLGDENS